MSLCSFKKVKIYRDTVCWSNEDQENFSAFDKLYNVQKNALFGCSFKKLRNKIQIFILSTTQASKQQHSQTFAIQAGHEKYT